MEIDNPEEHFNSVNVTACLVLNQRDDETLGLDFVTFPGKNEVLGVVDMTPGAHFVYIRNDSDNADIDTRIGEFIYIPDNTCVVLKRRKDNDGALFDLAEPDEARSYHSGLIAGHFAHKVAKIPEQLRKLWQNLTGFISEDVTRLLRPLDRRIASKSRFNIQRNIDILETKPAKGDQKNVKLSGLDNEKLPEDVCASLDKAAPSNSDPVDDDVKTTENRDADIAADSDRSITQRGFVKHAAHQESNLLGSDSSDPRKKFIALNDDEDTADDYRRIAMQFKQSRKKRLPFLGSVGLDCNLAGKTVSILASGDDPNRRSDLATLKQTATDTGSASQPVKYNSHDPLVDTEVSEEPCTIYYSDLRRINKNMTLLRSMSPSSVTNMHMDTTHILDAVAANHRRYQSQSRPRHCTTKEQMAPGSADRISNKYHEVIGEYQYAFCLFLLNYHYDSFEHWKSLFRAICGAESFFLENGALAEKVLEVIKLQLETFESDLYEPGNFFVYYLNSLDELLMDNQPQLQNLLPPLAAIKDTFKLKFGIPFEEAQVLQANIQIVDMEDQQLEA